MPRTNQPLHHPRDKNSLPPDNLLIVEGADDFHALRALCEVNKIDHRFHIEEAGGYEQLHQSLDVYLLTSGLRRIGFIVDADENLQERWESLRDRLLSDLCGYTDIEAHPNPSGTIIAQIGKPRLGLWVMPDNQIPGALEHFIQFLIPANDFLYPGAENTVQNLPALPYSTNPNWVAKSPLHTWLVWQEEPGKPMGQAILKRYLDHNVSQAKLFTTWLATLFEY